MYPRRNYYCTDGDASGICLSRSEDGEPDDGIAERLRERKLSGCDGMRNRVFNPADNHYSMLNCRSRHRRRRHSCIVVVVLSLSI